MLQFEHASLIRPAGNFLQQPVRGEPADVDAGLRHGR
jgi:hypothetical protein